MLFVTSFINLRTSYGKTPKFRLEQFQKLAEANISILVFCSPEYVEHIPSRANVRVVPYEFSINDERDLPRNRNNEKDTRAFLQLMNMKTHFVKMAMEANPSHDSFAWIDFNVFHVIKDCTKAQEKLARISSTPMNGMYLPGCWDVNPVSLDQVCWRFCGSIFMGDASSIRDFIEKVETTKLEKLTWEVNVWAITEQNGWSPIWYKADHNDTLFDIPI